MGSSDERWGKKPAEAVRSEAEVLPANQSVSQPASSRFALPGALWLRLLFLGGVSPLVQFIFLRELLGLYGGNEYLVGTGLGLWLLFSGAGGTVAQFLLRRREAGPLDDRLLVTLAFLPTLAVLFLRFARYRWFLTGAGLGLSQQIGVAAFAIAPFCLVSGFLLVDYSRRAILNRGSSALGAAYGFDALGSIVGGLCFVFLLAPTVGHLGIAALSGAILLVVVAGGPTAARGRARQRAIVSSLAAAALLLFGIVAEHPTLQWVIPCGRLVFETRSPYGQLLVSQLAHQRTYLRNGAVLFSTNVPELAEQSVHLALLAHPHPRRILVLGPPAPDVVRALLRHEPESVVFVEPDASLTTALRVCGDLVGDPRIAIVHTDARLFLRKRGGGFDVLLVNHSQPLTLLDNRLFTEEFAALAQRNLREGGVLAVPLGAYTEYLSLERALEVASVWRAFATRWPNVRLLPSETILLLASDRPLDVDFCRELRARQLRTTYVRPSYLEHVLTPERELALARVQRAAVSPNSDLLPVAGRHALARWRAEFGYRMSWAEVGLWVVALFLLSRLRRTEIAVFVSSLGACGLESLVFAVAQTLVGILYGATAILVTAFMAGLVAGSYVGTSIRPRSQLVAFCLVLEAALGAALGMLAWGVSRADLALAADATISCWGQLASHPLWTYLVLCACSAGLMALGLVTALIFVACGQLVSATSPSALSRLYAADFLGGSFAAIFFAVYLMPAHGTLCSSGFSALVLVAAALIAP